ncbi:MAG: TonB-dependent receptor [Desulfobacterales bacterium]|nr:TonB-dependent receptor [Desulfobacterales bacterium]
MNFSWLFMGILLFTLGATPAFAAEPAPIPAAQEASTTTKEDTPTKKKATPKAKEQAMPEVVVETERLMEKQDKITIKSEGLPANVNIITKEDVKNMPILHWTDMLRAVPGVRIQNFRGYFPPAISMRGFQSWRGSEVGIFIDGVPMNQPQGDMNGQANIGWLMPEIIERIEVIKGPFSALYGDFALAGVINIVTKKSDPSPSLAGYGGTYNTGRAVGVVSSESWGKSLCNITPFFAWEGFTQDGYQQYAELQRVNLFNKLSCPLWEGNVSVRLHYSDESGVDPGRLPLDRVKAGMLEPTTGFDNTCRNDNEELDVVLKYDPKGGEEGFHGTVFYTHNLWQRCSLNLNLTNQSRSNYRTNYLGWKLLYDYRPFDCLSLVVGNDLRNDEIKGIKMNSYRYNFNITPTYATYIRQFSTGFFAQGQYKPFSFIKFVGGLRYDLFNIDVDNKLNPANSGTAYPTIFSPKVGLVITPYKDINIFANRGQGFRSPSSTELSPATGTKNFDLDVAKLNTWDVGINTLLFKRLFISFDYYSTILQRETWRNPATQMYENLGDSKRTGFEIEAKIFLTPELTIYGSYSDVRGRIKHPQTIGQYYIPYLSPNTSTVGFEYHKTWHKVHRFGVNWYYLRYSRAPMTTNGIIIRPQYDRYLMKLLYGYNKWTASMDVALSPRRYSSEYMDYSNGFYYTPQPKWELLFGLKYQF